MPTLARFGALAVQMYFEDHAPPHFHIVGPGIDVTLRISDLEVIAGDVRPAQIAAVRRWASAHQGDLLAKWSELNGQDKR